MGRDVAGSRVRSCSRTGYAAIPLWLLPELAGAERVRIVVEPLDASGDHWAFVSSTHNETQHVTVLAPR